MKLKLHALAVLCLLSIAVSAQVARRAQITVRDATFHSASLGRQMKYRIILPAGYGSTSVRYPVLYLLHGLGGNFLGWDTRSHLEDYVAPLQLIIVMPDADDSWYSNSAGKPQDKFEDYIVKDLISEIDQSYRTIASRDARAIGGTSMGGYGAMKFALKYPNLFVFAASFSGALEIPHNPDSKIPFGGGKYDREVLEIFGPAASPARPANDPFLLAEKIEPAEVPYLWLACGTADGLLASNRQFVAVLQRRKIPYSYEESPGAHTWAYWDQEIPDMLRELAKHMKIRVRPESPVPGEFLPRNAPTQPHPSAASPH